MPSFILIRPTVWPQYTNVTGRQTRQRTDSIERTVLQTVAQKVHVRYVIVRLDSLLRRSKRLGYCSDDLPVVADMFSAADDELFRRTTSNPNHVLHPLYLPGVTDVPYQLRTRSHRMTLINKTKLLNDADFIIRLLYKHSYYVRY